MGFTESAAPAVFSASARVAFPFRPISAAACNGRTETNIISASSKAANTLNFVFIVFFPPENMDLIVFAPSQEHITPGRTAAAGGYIKESLCANGKID